ncbi:hypothetical protein TYRP_001518 [Tyrophagus putrescentiae]|nr:hypothetical protein TYRP_001518 [Tyrophagus putrescentiae]
MIPLEAMQRRSAATSVVTTAQQLPQLPWWLTCCSEAPQCCPQAVRPSKFLGSLATSLGKATGTPTGASATLMIRFGAVDASSNAERSIVAPPAAPAVHRQPVLLCLTGSTTVYHHFLFTPANQPYTVGGNAHIRRTPVDDLVVVVMRIQQRVIDAEVGHHGPPLKDLLSNGALIHWEPVIGAAKVQLILEVQRTVSGALLPADGRLLFLLIQTAISEGVHAQPLDPVGVGLAAVGDDAVLGQVAPGAPGIAAGACAKVHDAVVAVASAAALKKVHRRQADLDANHLLPCEAMHRRSAATSVVMKAQQEPQLPWWLTWLITSAQMGQWRRASKLGGKSIFCRTSTGATGTVTGASATLMIRFGLFVVPQKVTEGRADRVEKVLRRGSK